MIVLSARKKDKEEGILIIKYINQRPRGSKGKIKENYTEEEKLNILNECKNSNSVK